ncbi:hypothetical protein EXIGLDRAFT_835566 [Exidia glandulosa HHB12029]|uniref:Uncharacterized protein n=1 Tax=Exidia glandulosa HHB12029 TaxID=1314781 RepID=A0A166AN96_EXIGL|nr:hypothetical protein EXIGLDRAFT_835566 [Exidia glandulosa HHB12029]
MRLFFCEFPFTGASSLSAGKETSTRITQDSRALYARSRSRVVCATGSWEHDRDKADAEGPVQTPNSQKDRFPCNPRQLHRDEAALNVCTSVHLSHVIRIKISRLGVVRVPTDAGSLQALLGL